MRFILRNKYLKGDKEFLERKYERIREIHFFAFADASFWDWLQGWLRPGCELFGWPFLSKINLISLKMSESCWKRCVSEEIPKQFHLIYQAVISDSIRKVPFLERKFKFALTQRKKKSAKKAEKKAVFEMFSDTEFCDVCKEGFRFI